MKTKATIACTLALLSLAGRALAQAPLPSVTGITAEALNGQVIVQWNAVTNASIDYYRVYYSNYSILENDGLYDDFEVTQGNETSLTFVPPPQLNDLYISVLAVAKSGAESEYFTEETYIKVSTGGPAQPVPQPTSEQPDLPEIPEHTTLKLLNGTVTSPTEIVVEFSTSVTVDPARAPEGLHIKRGNGSELGITGITIEGKTITIKTEQQERGTVYSVEFSEPFIGKNGQALDAEDRTVLVTGHSDGKAAGQGQATLTPNDPFAPPDLQKVTINPQVQPNGAYTVTLEWQLQNPEGLYGIVVYQTRDGQTFGQPSLLPIDIRGVQLTDVTPGFFGLYLQTINAYGYTSPGVFQYANLPAYVPGYGFQGDLTFGSMKKENEIEFDQLDEDDGVATLEVMDDNAPTTTLEGAKLAAGDKPIDWESAGILALSIAGTMVLFVGLLVMFARKNGGSDMV